MIKQKKCGLRHFKFGNKGFSLLELALVIGVMALLLGGLSPSWIHSLYRQAGDKMAQEMLTLKNASFKYLKEQETWPDSIEDLKAHNYIYQHWDFQNPFHHPYELVHDDGHLLLRSNIPLKARKMIKAQIPMSIQDETGVGLFITAQAPENPVFPTGTILALASFVVPEGWLLCDGHAIDREEYSALFALIGISFGMGDGQNTFHLPDLRGRTIVGLDNMGSQKADVIKDLWAHRVGGVFGSATHQLTIAEMPRHKHDTPVNVDYRGSGQASMDTGKNIYNIYHPSSYAGEDKPHNNIQPSMALNWIIKT